MFFECYFAAGDEEKYEDYRKHYLEISRTLGVYTEFISRFEASDFLKEKTSRYGNVTSIRAAVWKADNVVIKLYRNPATFKLSIENQKIAFERGAGCELLDVWTNENLGEYFTISEYGGESIWDLYGNDAEDMLDGIEEKLSHIGIVQKDSCTWNYVEKDGKIRVIDYETCVFTS